MPLECSGIRPRPLHWEVGRQRSDPPLAITAEVGEYNEFCEGTPILLKTWWQGKRVSGVKELRLLGNLELICVSLSVNTETSLSLAACDPHFYSRNNVVCIIYVFTNLCLHTTEDGLWFCTPVAMLYDISFSDCKSTHSSRQMAALCSKLSYRKGKDWINSLLHWSDT